MQQALQSARSRVAQPARVRRFIDLAIERLSNNTEWVLSTGELSRAQQQGLRGLKV